METSKEHVVEGTSDKETRDYEIPPPESHPSNMFSILGRKFEDGAATAASTSPPTPLSVAESDGMAENVSGLAREHPLKSPRGLGDDSRTSNPTLTSKPQVYMRERSPIVDPQPPSALKQEKFPPPTLEDTFKKPLPPNDFIPAHPSSTTAPPANAIPRASQGIALNFNSNPSQFTRQDEPSDSPSNPSNSLYSQPYSLHSRRSYDLRSSENQQFYPSLFDQQTQLAHRHSFHYTANPSPYYAYSTDSVPRRSPYNTSKDIYDGGDSNHGGSISTAGPNRGGDVGLVASLMYLVEKGWERGQEIWEGWKY